MSARRSHRRSHRRSTPPAVPLPHRRSTPPDLVHGSHLQALQEFAKINLQHALDRPDHNTQAGSLGSRGRTSALVPLLNRSGMPGSSAGGGLAQFSAGSRFSGRGHGGERLPEFRPKTTSSFPAVAGDHGASCVLSVTRSLRSNGFGKHPTTTAHKHVFARGRNVRVHDMPAHIRGDC